MNVVSLILTQELLPLSADFISEQVMGKMSFNTL